MVAACDPAINMVGVHLQRTPLHLGQIDHAPGRGADLDRRQGGHPAALAHGADVEGADENDLLDGEIDVVVAPLGNQLTDLVEVIGGVATKALDAALDEAFVLREQLQESLPLVR
jgi:hypothetical protein